MTNLKTIIAASLIAFVGMTFTSYAQCNPRHSGCNKGNHRQVATETVELKGKLIIEKCEDDGQYGKYYIDVDNDGKGDYKLRIGPSKKTDNTLPKAGDDITVSGTVVKGAGCKDIIVTKLNGKDMPRKNANRQGNGHGHGCAPGCGQKK